MMVHSIIRSPMVPSIPAGISKSGVNPGGSFAAYFYKGDRGTLALPAPPPSNSRINIHLRLMARPCLCLVDDLSMCANSAAVPLARGGDSISRCYFYQ
jgi:hypothetical protein